MAEPPRRIAVIASASGNGKTTLGRELANQLGVEFVELDALFHGPNWTMASGEEVLAQLEPVLAADGWVIDGSYETHLGPAVLDAADLIVWLDLPIHVWMPRLMRRSWRRWRGREQLWNGNTESLKGLFWGRESLFGYALIQNFRKRRDYPDHLSRYNVTRLRSVTEVAHFRREFVVAEQVVERRES